MIRVTNANLKFNDKVMFASHEDLVRMYEEQGAENLDEVAENLDAVGYTSVCLEVDGQDTDGVLFFF